MNKQIEWINFIEKTHDEELKLRFSEVQSDEDSIDMGESIRNDCFDLFNIKGEEEQGSFDAIVNDILSSYPKEKNKEFNRIRHEWK
mgnify:FL=1